MLAFSAMKSINLEQAMQRTFELASLGMGHTSPNPLVGALLVSNGRIIGQGYHQVYGGPHAEINAIRDAQSRGEKIEGATLFCNLEPCCHTKKQTPPCAAELIKQKIGRVVIANVDPNPHVAGGGVAQLHQSGIEVVTGVLEEQGKKLNEVFFKFIQTGLPFVHLKMGQTLDGKVAARKVGADQTKYITGPESLAKVHWMRQKYDAIMIGANTLRLDNPSLTNRLNHLNHSNRLDKWAPFSPSLSEETSIFSEPLKISQPIRVIVTGNIQNLDPKASVFTDEFTHRTWVVTTAENDPQHSEPNSELNSALVQQWQQKGITLLAIENSNPKINSTDPNCSCPDLHKYPDLHKMLRLLGERKVTSVLLEGGPGLATEFLKAKLVDKVSFFVAPCLLGAGTNSINDLGLDYLTEKLDLMRPEYEILGKDFLVEGYL